jgi:WD40 repeat protein
MADRNSNISPHLRLLYTLRGHEAEINRFAWSPHGRYLASPSFDGTVRIWDIQTGLQGTITEHKGAVYTVAWSPDGRLLASCSQDKRVLVWDMQDGHYYSPPSEGGHTGNIYDIAWLRPSSSLLVSCSEDQTIKIWRASRAGKYIPLQLLHTLFGHTSSVYCLACAPDGKIFASGSSHGPIRLWDALAPLPTQNILPPSILYAEKGTLRGQSTAIYSMVWSPDGKLLASASNDRTIRLWDPIEERQIYTIEWHTNAVTGLSFSHDGRLLASKSCDGTVCLWRTDTWENVATIPAPASNGMFAGVVFHPHAPLLATLSEQDRVICIWEVDIPALLGLAPARPSIHYANAKVVLVGESGVGKTALGLVLTGQPFSETSSTHGRYVRIFDERTVAIDARRKEQREIYLWDLAGQTGYRLIHQLHLNEVAVALIVFSDTGGDPLAGVTHWARSLRAIQSVEGNATIPIKKLLVEARIDRGHVRLSREQLNDAMQKFGFDGYYQTSAMGGQGVAELAEAIRQAIDWNLLPKATSTELFQRIKEFLVRLKERGYRLQSASNLYRLLTHELTEQPEDLHAQFETCLGLLEAQGLLRRLSFGQLVLLQPELLDAYASALVNAVRADPEELGSIVEATVLEGNFALPSDVRLDDRNDERLLLLAMVEDLLRYEVALREGNYLVFPSEVMRRDVRKLDPPGKTIIFTFEGPVLNIYATLAVRLSHSGIFRKRALWQNAVEFDADVGGTCGIALRTLEEGKGELTLFFDAAASEETRYHFEEYVRTHLERRAAPRTIARQRLFVCPQCNNPFHEQQVAFALKLGHKSLLCPICRIEVPLLDREERLAHTPDSLVPQMDRAANERAETEASKSVIQGKTETQDFDVFLCYHGEDRAAVKNIGERLKTQGILPWLDEWELRPGLPWQRLLEQQIEHIKSAAVFVGKSGTGPWQQMELEAFLRQFNRRGCPVIPVILADAPSTPQLPIFLQGMTWVDFRKPDPDPMARLIWGITGRKLF